MYKPGDPHWESLLEIFDRYRLHENGYTGYSYYEENETMTLAYGEGEDLPWCCEYSKKTFVEAWDKVKEMVAYWHFLDEEAVEYNDHVATPSLVYRRRY
jgi:hypothetical protein